jgi:iron complex outermembrane receptor protein
LTNKVLAGLDYFDLRANTDYRTQFAGDLPPYLFGEFPPIDAYAPVYNAVPAPFAQAFPFILRNDQQQQIGIYLQDQVKLDRWTLTLTGRRDRATSDFDSQAFYPAPGHYTRDDAATTGRVGLNYLFDFGLSPYVTYSTTFTPNLGADLTGDSFKPTTGEGGEVGFKFKPVGSNFMITAAAFDIKQKDVLTPVPNTIFSVQTDSVRVKGFEFELRGNLTREFELVGGYTHLDPKVDYSQYGYTGKYMINTALDQASLWGKYTWYGGPLAGLGLGAGVRYVGETYGDNFNTFVVPSYTLVDAAVSYDFAYMRPDLKGLKAQINVTNLFDHYYVASCFTGLPYCGFGNARTVLGTLRYAWN